ncbi:MAG: hypothetical protein R2873_21740 [Caldilineaceae bacterium]
MTGPIDERHRHRFEFNNAYREMMEAEGLVISGQSPDGRLVEIVEVADHPFMVGSQFHPEFKSRPNRPHPLFLAFVQAAVQHRGQDGQGTNGVASQQTSAEMSNVMTDLPVANLGVEESS